MVIDRMFLGVGGSHICESVSDLLIEIAHLFFLGSSLLLGWQGGGDVPIYFCQTFYCLKNLPRLSVSAFGRTICLSDGEQYFSLYMHMGLTSWLLFKPNPLELC